MIAMNESRTLSRPSEVYFFGTCLIDVFYPESGLSAIQLIERNGIKVIFPPQQTCCGQPPYNSGYKAEAIEVASQQIKLFSRPIPVVVPSASCAAMMKHHYPRLFEGHKLHAQVLDLSNRVYEFTEFLSKRMNLSLQDKGPPVKIAIHHSCSARREMNITDETMRLLDQLHNVEICEPERASECCGFGGTFAIKQPEISAAMAFDKCKAIEKTGARTLISGDCGCLMNLAGMMEKNNTPMRTDHIASFLLSRTR
jgi:L-lactate dehydrogenase complex protein LldE